MAIDLASDFPGAVDGLEAVTLKDRDGRSAQNVAKALRRAIGRREAAASSGRYTAADAVWHLPEGELSQPPEIGDVIVDSSGERWTILAVSHSSLVARFRCVARDLAIAGGLDSFITLQRAVHTKSATGSEETRWVDCQTGLRARVQAVEGDVAAEHGRRMMRHTHQVFLSRAITVDHNHRIVHQGAVYHVLGYEMPERVDKLFVINARRSPWPLATKTVAPRPNE